MKYRIGYLAIIIILAVAGIITAATWVMVLAQTPPTSSVTDELSQAMSAANVTNRNLQTAIIAYARDRAQAENATAAKAKAKEDFWAKYVAGLKSKH